MSARSEALERAVDSEWRTTAEIIAKAGLTGDPHARECAVHRLISLRRQGRVEMR